MRRYSIINVRLAPSVRIQSENRSSKRFWSELVLKSRASGTISLRMAPDRPFTSRVSRGTDGRRSRKCSCLSSRRQTGAGVTQTSPTTTCARSLETRQRCSWSFMEFPFRVAPFETVRAAWKTWLWPLQRRDGREGRIRTCHCSREFFADPKGVPEFRQWEVAVRRIEKEVSNKRGPPPIKMGENTTRCPSIDAGADEWWRTTIILLESRTRLEIAQTGTR